MKKKSIQVKTEEHRDYCQCSCHFPPFTLDGEIPCGSCKLKPVEQSKEEQCSKAWHNPSEHCQPKTPSVKEEQCGCHCHDPQKDHCENCLPNTLQEKLKEIILKSQIDPTSVTYWDGILPEVTDLISQEIETSKKAEGKEIQERINREERILLNGGVRNLDFIAGLNRAMDIVLEELKK